MQFDGLSVLRDLSWYEQANRLYFSTKGMTI